MNGRLAAIFLGGLIAGSIDLGAASLISGVSVERVLRFIAAALIGKPAAKAGGPEILALGYGLQVGMSMLIAAFYVVGAAVMPVLGRLWIAFGALFGVGVYFVMTYGVVPLSKVAGPIHFSLKPMLLNLAAMVVFGLIVAFFAHRFAPRSVRASAPAPQPVTA
jgi:hypothetical protein